MVMYAVSRRVEPHARRNQQQRVVRPCQVIRLDHSNTDLLATCFESTLLARVISAFWRLQAQSELALRHAMLELESYRPDQRWRVTRDISKPQD